MYLLLVVAFSFSFSFFPFLEEAGEVSIFVELISETAIVALFLWLLSHRCLFDVVRCKAIFLAISSQTGMICIIIPHHKKKWITWSDLSGLTTQFGSSLIRVCLIWCRADVVIRPKLSFLHQKIVELGSKNRFKKPSEKMKKNEWPL